MTLRSYSNFEEKLASGLKKDMRKGMTLKFTEELCVMTMKNNAKFEEELTFAFKFEMRNLANFDSSTPKSKKIAL